MADQLIRFGVSNSRYALETDEGFGDFVRVPGTVQVQIEPQESNNDFYADNTKYFTTYGAANDNVTIELADITDQLKIDLLGYIRKAEGAGLLMPVNAKRAKFAYAFQIEGNEKALRVCIYGGQLGRPSNTYATKGENTEPATSSISGNFGGRTFTVDGEEQAFLYYTSMEGDSDYDGFFDAVPVPGTIPAATGGTTGGTTGGGTTGGGTTGGN